MEGRTRILPQGSRPFQSRTDAAGPTGMSDSFYCKSKVNVVPDSRSHRGAHPADRQLFGSEQLPRLRQACRDLSWLMTRRYASKSALKLVGDRYCLTERQRLAVTRCACSDQALAEMDRGQQAFEANGRSEIWIDGYNVLTSIEAAIAGGVILKARDGCFRDMASMHGTWRRVEETIPAIAHVGESIEQIGIRQCRWVLDRPVSNSGRLKALLLQQAARRGWDWTVELHANPDRVLAEAKATVATADRQILLSCSRWLNLARNVIQRRLPTAWIVDLSVEE